LKQNKSGSKISVPELSHIAKDGSVKMVDVSGKPIVKRKAVASATIHLQPATVQLLKDGLLKKGDPLACARIAGIMAAKKTSELIPLCHNLSLDEVAVDFNVMQDRICVVSSVVCIGRTGVEMEALISASVAALTIYDMCKAVDKNMRVNDVILIKKTKESLV
jgi:cyclic pyranopterin phosphate synthase